MGLTLSPLHFLSYSLGTAPHMYKINIFFNFMYASVGLLSKAAINSNILWFSLLCGLIQQTNQVNINKIVVTGGLGGHVLGWPPP